jgi:putative ABC transport system permease protein
VRNSIERLLSDILPMGIPFAWRQLSIEKKRLMAAIAGVSFGAIIMTFQLEIYNAAMLMSVRPHVALKGELVMLDRNYEYSISNVAFTRRRLDQAKAVPGVKDVFPLYTVLAPMRNPETHMYKLIYVMGIDPDANPWTFPEVEDNLDLLKDPENMLFDALSRNDIGPIPALFTKYGSAETEIAGKKVRVKGLFHMGQTLAATAHVIMSYEGLCRIQPGRDSGMINVGLISLQPGADPDETARKITRALPGDVEVISHHEYIRREQIYWKERTPIGFITVASMFVAMVVGAVVVYQILYTDITDHLSEYATLKAIGFKDRFFVQLILTQSLMLLALSMIPFLPIIAALNYVTQHLAGLPAYLSVEEFAIVFLVATFMCTAAGLLATRRLRTADPADIF